uniref:Uncharacterized protein n=1 Tax=Trichogramma kaykai TaxID=54128 RepID=A0ABD2XQP6_9HYME
MNSLKSLGKSAGASWFNWRKREERYDLDKLHSLISDWQGELPNLLEIFSKQEIERLLCESIDYMREGREDEGELIITFVALTGYRDEPELDENGEPLLHRTTALLHLSSKKNYPKRWVNAVKELFKIYHRRDVNYTDERTGRCHFNLACASGIYEAVEEFLEVGQDHSTTYRSFVPLYYCALLNRQAEVYRLLLSRGADPALAPDWPWCTPLHLISQSTFYDDEMVELLFETTDDAQLATMINARNQMGDTPLFYALFHRNEEFVESLLRKGADPNSANFNQETPLHYVLDSTLENDEALETLFEISDEVGRPVQVNATTKDGRTPLLIAVTRLQVRAVEMLLARGADLSGFAFPSELVFVGEMKRQHRLDKHFKLKLASGALAIVDSLARRGYELTRGDATTIMKSFAECGLFDESADPEESWIEDEALVRKAKKIMMRPDQSRHNHDDDGNDTDNEEMELSQRPNLSLYDLIRLRPEKAAKLLTFTDYYDFARSEKLSKLPESHRDACALHLCEKLSKKFFRRWALDPLWELIHYRLPILCCESIIENLSNEDLLNICLAVEGQDSWWRYILNFKNLFSIPWFKIYIYICDCSSAPGAGQGAQQRMSIEQQLRYTRPSCCCCCCCSDSDLCHSSAYIMEK